MVTLIKEIPSLDICSAAYIKVCCAAAAYSEFEKIALFWKQTDDSGNVTALIFLIDDSMTICNISGDIEELSAFIKCIGPSLIFTELTTAEALNLKIGTVCDTLYTDPPYDFTDAAENTYEGLDVAYKTVTDRLYVGDETAFKADISHRIRHNCAAYVTTPLSAAFLLYCEQGAILSGIAVKEESARKGIGSATFKRVLMMARQRRVYVCAEEKNTPFYLKNGLKKIERCAYCKL